MDLLSRLFIFSPMKEKKTFTNVFIRNISSLRSWRDYARACFCSGWDAVNGSGEAVRGLVKSRDEFPPAQIRRVFNS